MPFDRKNPADLAKLKNELVADPVKIGFPAVIHKTEDVLSKFNTEAENKSRATVSKPRADMTIQEVAGVINADDYGALSQYDREWVKALIGQPHDSALGGFEAKFNSVFPNPGNTHNAVEAALIKPATRAEELFGYGTKISRDDFIIARES